jgi:cell division protein FtsI (penicillin-binding protein 3)
VTPGDGGGGRPEWSRRGPARSSARPAGPRGGPGPGKGPGSERRPGEPGTRRGGRPDRGNKRAGGRGRPAGPRPPVGGEPGGPRGRGSDGPARGNGRSANAGGRGDRGRRRARLAAARPKSLRRAGPARRLSISMLSIVLVLGVFGGRLVQLQGLHWSFYRAQAQEQMLPPQPISIPVLRGSITSSDNTVLAMTVPTYKVYADPVQIKQPKRAQVAAALAGPLGMTQAAILALIDYPSSPQYVVLKQNVSAAAGARITSLITSQQLPGIAEAPTYTRVYPNDDLAANLIGFTNEQNGDLTGDAGLEQEYNSLLAGRDGSEEVEMGPTQQPIPQTEEIVKQPVPAGSLELTIQSDIQWYAEQQCAAEVKATKARNCSVVVMQPSTGRILALAQYPTYNPAAPASEAATADIPVQNLFQPGSTAKVITVAAALERGGQTPMTTYTVPDQIVVDGFAFHDGETHPTERYTIAGILANSLNDGMVQVVQHVSPQVQYQYFRAFGIGSDTGLGLAGESPGLLPKPGTSNWYGDTRYTLSFGQGVAVNAVQMASVYATIANGGVRVQPSLVAGTVSGSGAFRPAPAPKRTRVLQPKTASELMAILQQVPVVDAEGGEPWGVISGYPVASKTGTAEVAGPRCSLCEYGSSYIGITPANDPQLVVAVNVQDPTKGGYFGDEVAGPVFYHVAKFALQTLRIPPDNAKRPRVRLTVP